MESPGTDQPGQGAEEQREDPAAEPSPPAVEPTQGDQGPQESEPETTEGAGEAPGEHRTSAPPADAQSGTPSGPGVQDESAEGEAPAEGEGEGEGEGAPA